MNENEKKSGDWKMIIGGIALIVVLFVGIKFIFWALGEIIHQDNPDSSQSVSVSQPASSQFDSASQDGQEEPPSFCVHCGKALPDSFQWGQFCPWCGEKIEQ